MTVNIEALKEEANGHFKAKDYKSAILGYSEAISLLECDPATVELKSTLLSNRSQCHLYIGDYKNALNDAKESIELNNNQKSIFRLHTALFHLGDFQGSLQALKEAKVVDSDFFQLEQIILDFSRLESDPQLTRVENLMYRILQYKQNQVSVDFSSKLIPFKVKRLRIAALLDNQRLDDANEAIRKELLNDQRNPDTLYFRAMALYLNDSGNDHIIKMLSACLNYDPDHNAAMNFFKFCKKMNKLREDGNLAFKSADYNGALKLYGDFLEADTVGGIIRAKIYSNRAIVYSRMSDNAKVMEDCNSAQSIMDKLLFPKLKPDDLSMEDRQLSQHAKLYSKIYLRRADIYSKEEKYEEALREYESCKILDRENREIHAAIKQMKRKIKMAERKDYYKILGVSKDADTLEIKRSYRKLALKYHPDRLVLLPEGERAAAEVMFKDVGEAYDILSDDRKRQQYDMGPPDEGMDLADLFSGGGFGGHSGGFPFEFTQSQFGGGHGFGGHSHNHGGFRGFQDFEGF